MNMITRKTSLLFKNSTISDELKQHLGRFAVYKAKCFGNLTKIVAISSGKEIILGDDTIISKADIQSERKRLFDSLKKDPSGKKCYSGSFSDFCESLPAVGRVLSTRLGATFIYTCFYGAKKPQKSTANKDRVEVVKLYSAGLFDTAPFKFDESEFRTSEYILSILKHFIAAYSSWKEINEEWNKNKAILIGEITNASSNPQMAMISSAIKELASSYSESYPIDEKNIAYALGKLLSRRNQLILNSKGSLSDYTPAVNAVLTKYSELWKGDECLLSNIECRVFLGNLLELHKKYKIKQGCQLIDKPSCYFPQLNKVEVAIARPLISLGNNYIPFDIPYIHANGSMGVSFHLAGSKRVLECYPSRYFGNPSCKVVQAEKNKKKNDLTLVNKPGRFLFDFKIYANPNRLIDGSFTRSALAEIKEPELRIVPVTKVIGEKELLAGKFDLELEIPYNLDPQSNHGFNTEDLEKLSASPKKGGLLSKPISPFQPGATQKSADTTTSEILKICKGKELIVMGIDLGIAPLAGYCIQSLKYGTGKDIFPDCPCEQKEIETGFIDSDFPKTILKGSNFQPVPFQEFTDKVKQLQNLCDVMKSMNYHIVRIRANQLVGNETKRFANKGYTLSQVLEMARPHVGDMQDVYASNDSFIAHVQSLPAEHTWTRHRHPLKPFFWQIMGLMKEMKQYRKDMIFREFFDYHKAFTSALSRIKSYRTFGWSHLKDSPADLDQLIANYRNLLSNHKELFIKTFASRIAKLAFKNKVAIIALEELAKSMEGDKKENTFFSLWAPSRIAHAIENAAGWYGISVAYVDPYYTSQYSSLNGDLGYRDKDNKRNVYFTNGDTLVALDSELNAARNICYLLASRHNFAKKMEVVLSADRSRAKMIVSDSKRRYGALTHIYQHTHPVFELRNEVYVHSKDDGKTVFKEKSSLFYTVNGWLNQDSRIAFLERIKKRVK
jgi:IS605 OrfB family transposase